jgi:uncharacterized repeat protein (TIGR04002 family)
MQSSSIRKYVFAGMFTAMTFLVTAYVLHIPTPATGGYIHLGDAFLYLSASLLPAPWGIAAGAVGEALSDLLTGSAVYAVPTLLIKTAMAFCFTSAGKTIVTKRNTAASVAAGLICVGGYYLTEVILYHSFIAPIPELPANLVQAGASAAIYLLAGRALDRVHGKSSLTALLAD